MIFIELNINKHFQKLFSVKVKKSLAIPCIYLGEVDQWLYTYATSAPDGSGWSSARSGRDFPRKRPGTHCVGGWVRVRWTRVLPSPFYESGKSRFHGGSKPDRPSPSESLCQLLYHGRPLILVTALV
jgi:hypothetical protein